MLLQNLVDLLLLKSIRSNPLGINLSLAASSGLFANTRARILVRGNSTGRKKQPCGIRGVTGPSQSDSTQKRPFWPIYSLSEPRLHILGQLTQLHDCQVIGILHKRLSIISSLNCFDGLLEVVPRHFELSRDLPSQPDLAQGGPIQPKAGQLTAKQSRPRKMQRKHLKVC